MYPYGAMPPPPGATKTTCDKLMGLLLGLFAGMTLGMGVGDVMEMSSIYPVNMANQTMGDARFQTSSQVYAYIASGIWGSIPIMLMSMFAMKFEKDPDKKTLMAAMSFLAGVIAAPAMVVLSAIEVYMGYGLYYVFPPAMLPNGIMPDWIRFAFPTIVAVLGFLELLLSVRIMMKMCYRKPEDQGPAAMMDGYGMMGGKPMMGGNGMNSNGIMMNNMASPYGRPTMQLRPQMPNPYMGYYSPGDSGVYGGVAPPPRSIVPAVWSRGRPY